jgi:type II secretory pathway component PulM
VPFPKGPVVVRKIRIPPVFDGIAQFMNSRTLREKQMIVIFSVIIVAAVDYLLWFQPVLGVIGRHWPEIAALSQRRTEMKRLKDNESEVRRRAAESEAELAAREGVFVESDEIPALLENLSGEAQKSGVRIVSLKPVEASASARGAYLSVPIQIKATAGMHELGAFLSRLETGDTYFRVLDLKIAPNSSDERRHGVDLAVETLRREA